MHIISILKIQFSIPGTMASAIKLLKKTGATVVECLAVIELTSLNGRSKLDVPVHSFVQYE